jgi:hypothetical protein
MIAIITSRNPSLKPLDIPALAAEESWLADGTGSGQMRWRMPVIATGGIEFGGGTYHLDGLR